MKTKLKKYEVPIYLSLLAILTCSIYLGELFLNKKTFESDNIEYVDREIVTDNEYIPVIIEEPTIIKPFLLDSVNINKTYYNYTADSSSQEKSLIYYENTYMQNSGVDYTSNEIFDIISVYDGTVIEVNDNEILGKTIKIRHSNELISIYQSLKDINVKVDDQVLRGQVIGTSGTSNLYKDNNNLHFELYYNGKSLNPEDNYNKRIDELN